MHPELTAYLEEFEAKAQARYDRQSARQDALLAKLLAGVSTPQPAHSPVVASDGGLAIDAADAAVLPEVSSSTTKALEVLPDASLDSIDPMPVTCSTNCSNQVVATAVCSEPAVDLNDHEVEQLAPARATPSIGTGTSSITEEVAPSVAATTDVNPKAGVQELDALPLFSINTSTAVTSEAYHIVDPSDLAAPTLAMCSTRPMPWPSLVCSHELHVKHARLLSQVTYEVNWSAAEWWSVISYVQSSYEVHAQENVQLKLPWPYHDVVVDPIDIAALTPIICSTVGPDHLCDKRLRPSYSEQQPWPTPVQVKIRHMGHLFRPRPWPSFKSHSDASYPEEPDSGMHSQPQEGSQLEFMLGHAALCSTPSIDNLQKTVQTLNMSVWCAFWSQEGFKEYLGFALDKAAVDSLHIICRGVPLPSMCTHFQAETIQNWMLSLVQLQHCPFREASYLVPVVVTTMPDNCHDIVKLQRVIGEGALVLRGNCSKAKPRPPPWPSFKCHWRATHTTKSLSWLSCMWRIGPVQEYSCPQSKIKALVSNMSMVCGNRSSSHGYIIGIVLLSPSGIWCLGDLILGLMSCWSDIQYVQQTNSVLEAPLCHGRHIIQIFWQGVAPSFVLADSLEEKSNGKPKYSVTITSYGSGYKLLNKSLLNWRTSAVFILFCCSTQFLWKGAGLFYHLSNCCPVTQLRLLVSANYFTLMYAVHNNQSCYMQLSHSNHYQEGTNLKVDQTWCALKDSEIVQMSGCEWVYMEEPFSCFQYVQLQVWRLPPHTHGSVPGAKQSRSNFWPVKLLFRDAYAHEAWSDCSIIDTYNMSKLLGISFGDETRYGVATRWSGHDDAWLDRVLFQLLEFVVKLANLLEKLQKYFSFLVDRKPWPSWELSLLIVTLVRTIFDSCHKLVLLQKFLVEGAVNIQFPGPLHGTHGECWLLPFPSGYHRPNPWFLQCTALNLASTSLEMVMVSPSGLEEGQPNAMLLTTCVVMLQTAEFYSIGVSSWQYAMPVVNQWILMGCSPNTWNSFEVNLVIDGFLQAWVSSCLTRYIILGTFELMQWKIPWLFSNPLLGVWFQFFPTVALSHCIPRAIHLYLSLKCSTRICYLEIQIRSSAVCSILVMHLPGMLNIHNALPTVDAPIDATYSFTSTSDAFYSNERGLCPTASELLLPQNQGYKEPCFHIRDSWGLLKICDGKDAAIHIVGELFLPWDPGILGIAVEDIPPFRHQVLLTIPCSSLLDGEEFSTGFGQAPFQGGRSIMVLTFFVGHDYYPALVRVNSVHVRLPQRPPQSWPLRHDQGSSSPWDPGEFFVATAWGQADFQGGRGVSDLSYSYTYMGWFLGAAHGPGPFVSCWELQSINTWRRL